jgi:hypothetical protein
MLVDLYLLREDGRKRSAAQVQASPPLRGHLRVGTHRAGPTASPDVPKVQTTAGLHEGAEQCARIMRMLEFVRITRLSERGFVFVGLERQGHPAVGVRVPQAWWCVPVGEAAPGATVESGPLEVPLA